MKKPFNNRGFTLVEVMVYLAILVIVSSVSVATLISYQDVIAEQKVKRLLTSNAQSVLERATREIRNADALDQFGSTLGTGSDVIDLTNIGDDVVISASGGAISIAVGSAPAVLLTDDEVNVDNFTAEFFDNGVTEFVSLAITLSATSSQRASTETFYGGAVLRGSYD